MIRLAFILQVIFGLIIGPNGCCCTAHRIAGLFGSHHPSQSDSCYASDPAEDQSASACCSECGIASRKESKPTGACSLSKTGSCCSQTDSCLCIRVIRPSIHRVHMDIDPIRFLSDHAMVVEWRASDFGNSSVVLEGTTLRLDDGASDHPSRVCAIAFQRWNC